MNRKIDDIQEILVETKRVSKVVKGGTRFSFSALVVVGDKNGRVGYAVGKALEAGDARRKAAISAKKNMVKVPMYKKRTIHHDVFGKSGASKILLRQAKPGTGIIAGGSMRAVLSLLGLHDIVAKSFGSSNPHSMISATFDALTNVYSAKLIAESRNISLSNI